MKIKQKKKFIPIVITLETADEAALIFALMNHAKLKDKLEPARDGLIAGIWEFMRHIDLPYAEYHKAICDLVDRK